MIREDKNISTCRFDFLLSGHVTRMPHQERYITLSWSHTLLAEDDAKLPKDETCPPHKLSLNNEK